MEKKRKIVVHFVYIIELLFRNAFCPNNGVLCTQYFSLFDMKLCIKTHGPVVVIDMNGYQVNRCLFVGAIRYNTDDLNG